MIRKLVITSLATAAIAGSALAADLPARMAPPVAYAPPVFTWTGAYVGINGGGIFSNNQNNGLAAVPGACSAAVAGCVVVPNYSTLIATGINGLGVGNNNGRGAILGGGQIGINYQVNSSFVFGGEIDGQGVWSNRNNNNNFGTVVVPSPAFPAFPVTVTGGVNHRLEYLATARLRAGFLATPGLLIYGTGGAAFGGVRTNGFATAGIAPPDPSVPGFAAVNSTQSKIGWTAGGGLEWMFLPNWSLKGEALYYDLGRFNTSFAPVAVTAIAGGAVTGSALVSTSTRERGIIARGGLNYHFGWTEAAPVVARY